MPESPADTIRRAAERLRRDCEFRMFDDANWMRAVAGSWEVIANVMDTAPLFGLSPSWAATLAAARAYLGEAKPATPILEESA